MKLEAIIESIRPLDQKQITRAQAFCDQLAKPLGAFGRLEDIYVRLSAILGPPVSLSPKVTVVYVADHGVVEEGVSSNPQSTTYQVACNILQGKSGLCGLSKYAGSDVHLLDLGCCQPITGSDHRKLCSGTANFLKGPAMSREVAIAAILAGYEETVALIDQGYQVIGTGEMGIGNTTTSVAVIAAILGGDPVPLVGYGAGLDQQGLARKTEVILQALQQHTPFTDVLDVVAKVGSLDILGMAGSFLACAQKKKVAVVDGLISITGLLVASRLQPTVLDYVFLSNASPEPAFAYVCEDLGLVAYFDLGLRLGEGSACPLMFSLMDAAVTALESFPTFDEAGLSQSDYIDIRKIGDEKCNSIQKQATKA